MAALKATELADMIIHSSKVSQIDKGNSTLQQTVQLAAFQQDKALTKILIEYRDYANMFSPNLVMELSKNTGINKNAIKLVKRKQSPYRSIYILNSVKLGILKTYIKTHLKIEFIQPFKLLASTPLLCDKKLDNSLYLNVNYQNLNNLTIKNWYLFLLMNESLDQLDWAKRFT